MHIKKIGMIVFFPLFPRKEIVVKCQRKNKNQCVLYKKKEGAIKVNKYKDTASKHFILLGLQPTHKEKHTNLFLKFERVKWTRKFWVILLHHAWKPFQRKKLGLVAHFKEKVEKSRNSQRVGQLEILLRSSALHWLSRSSALQIFYIWATTWQNQQNECAPSEDSDEPGHPPSLFRVFTVPSMGS